jgi:AraC-like DNA-binding protein
MDRLLSLLPRFGFRTTVFFQGHFCGQNQFRADDGVGHLHLVRQGHVVMEHTEAPPIEIHTPTLVFYPRPYDHRLIVPTESQAALLCANVCFNQADRNPIALALPEVLLVPLAEEPGLAPTLDLLFQEAAEGEIGRRLVMDHLCDILVVHLIRHARKKNLISNGALSGLSDPYLASVLAAIHANPGHGWTIEKMACIARLSRTVFASRFRDVVGVPPAEYLSNWRMELAKSYLIEGKAIKEVARDIGYAYQPAFTKAFTSKFGISPTEWRAQSSQPRLSSHCQNSQSATALSL